MKILYGNISHKNESNYKFKLDNFQKHAMNSIDLDENVLVTASTGSGKSLIAEYAIEQSFKKNKKVIYTSPIKSLSNQKFYEFKQKYSNVGILTGDIKFNPVADCIIMTTEILRNLLYTNMNNYDIELDISNDVDTVIFDEIHYINDIDRGGVWEECIMMLPNNIKLVMLSATISNEEQFAEWIGKIKDREINLIPQPTRIIPLTHYFYIETKKEKNGYLDEHSNKLVEILDNNNKLNNINFDKMYFLKKKTEIKEIHLLNNIVKILDEDKLTPALFFTLSKSKCEYYASSIINSFNTHDENAEIERLINFYLNICDNKKLYQTMNQFIFVKSLLFKGIAVHHSGLIPIIKEIIELLFSRNLIKILFATETFAVGINMPTKTVLYTGFSKYDNHCNGFRTLYTHEYRQMSGRAGRRGLDHKGIIIHLPNLYELPIRQEYINMMTGITQKISSKFNLNYQYVLKMLLSNNKDIIKCLDKSLMNKDLNNTIKFLYESIEKLEKELYVIDDITLMEEYNLLSETKRSIIKLSNKEMKMNRQRKYDIEQIKGFNEKYNNYIKYIEKIKQINQMKEEIKNYETMIDDDLMKIINFLEEEKYIQNGIVQLKGIIASHISECNPILLTEILERGILDNLNVEKIIEILSIFIDETRDITEEKQYIFKTDPIIIEIQKISTEMEKKDKIGINWIINVEYMEKTREWVNGTMIDGYEGNFVRDIIRLNNIGLNLINLSKIMGKFELSNKFSKISELIIKDIVSVDSLYIKL